MSEMQTLAGLAEQLNGLETENGTRFSTSLESNDDLDVLTVTAEDHDEFPIYVTIDESQLLCTSHLWHESEVKSGERETMLDAMLAMNVAMPLSSFSKVGDQYIIFGALASHSSTDDVALEIETLAENTLDAVEGFVDFLN